MYRLMIDDFSLKDTLDSYRLNNKSTRIFEHQNTWMHPTQSRLMSMHIWFEM